MKKNHDVMFFRQEIDGMAEAVPHSRDMIKSFGDLQTRMLEAVVNRKCRELKRSLKSLHTSERKKLKLELEESIRQ